ncbi:alcohol dehydrogenase [Aureococcus anophagefferens]|uniref:Alcohol dehydrogenase n=1 Tax=Aureococcus anophagefferens TaxID=44056 RepID=A0ABR1G9V8_AURAN
MTGTDGPPVDPPSFSTRATFAGRVHIDNLTAELVAPDGSALAPPLVLEEIVATRFALKKARAPTTRSRRRRCPPPLPRAPSTRASPRARESLDEARRIAVNVGSAVTKGAVALPKTAAVVAEAKTAARRGSVMIAGKRLVTRAAVCEAFGAPVVARRPGALPLAPTSVHVRCEAAGLNFAEALQLKGEYQEKLEPLFAARNGALASSSPSARPRALRGRRRRPRARAAAPGPATSSCPRPPSPLGTGDDADARKAAGAAAGETVLVTAAAGGVGLAAVDLAARCRRAGRRRAGDDAKLRLALDRGAAAGVVYGGTDAREFRAALREAAPEGIDVAVDMVGGDFLEPIVRSLAFDGRCVVVGFASGTIPKIPANLLLVKNCALVGLFWGAHAIHRPAVFADSLRNVVGLWRAGDIAPHVSATYALADADAAVAALVERRSSGKIVLAAA